MEKSRRRWAWFLGLLAVVAVVGCDLPDGQTETNRSGSQDGASIGDSIDEVIKNP
jgi:hypothetical protein